VKSALILTAGFGEGHNAAARNLREALIAKSPEANVVVSDVFLEAYGWFNRLAQRSYIGTINHAPLVWQGIFHLLDRTKLVEWHIGIFRAAARRLEALISEHRPDVIVSTYPGCNHLLDFVYRKRSKRPFHTVTVVTDSLTINTVWHRAHSDHFIVANEATGAVMREAGVPGGKIHLLGFPVPRLFGSLQNVKNIHPPDGKWRVLYVINSGRRIAPEIVRHLLELPGIHLTVTVGRDEELGRKVTSVAAGKPFDLFGWTPDMPRLMAESHLLISKAGGATVQETLAAQTPMIVTQIVPGQEEGNARLVMESHAGALAITPAEIARTVAEAFRNDATLWRSWHRAASSLSHPRAADDIARFLTESPEA
jgi:processive 1,2-diacylglycerol beta-glucosyltransferase